MSKSEKVSKSIWSTVNDIPRKVKRTIRSFADLFHLLVTFHDPNSLSLISMIKVTQKYHLSSIDHLSSGVVAAVNIFCGQRTVVKCEPVFESSTRNCHTLYILEVFIYLLMDFVRLKIHGERPKKGNNNFKYRYSTELVFVHSRSY